MFYLNNSVVEIIHLTLTKMCMLGNNLQLPQCDLEYGSTFKEICWKLKPRGKVMRMNIHFMFLYRRYILDKFCIGQGSFFFRRGYQDKG